MNNFLAGPAFSADGRVFRWTDVVLAAVLRRDWSSFSDGVERRLALAASAEARGETPTDQELEAAAEEFRYARDLITAEDMEAWLDRRGLSVDEWMAYVERSVLESPGAAAAATDDAGDAEDDAEGEKDAAPPSAVDGESFRECLAVEAICSGALTRFAASLAGRVALDERISVDPSGGGAAPSPEEIRSLVETLSTEIARSPLPDLDEIPPERLEELARMELVFQGHRRRLASASALRNEIEANRLEWIRVDLQGLSFADEASAREALFCLREDGETFEDVAASARLRLRDERILLSEIDPAAKPDLLSARPGELVGPLAFGERFHIFRLREKTMPSEDDPEIRRRAEDSLIARLVERETEARIRWLDPL